MFRLRLQLLLATIDVDVDTIDAARPLVACCTMPRSLKVGRLSGVRPKASQIISHDVIMLSALQQLGMLMRSLFCTPGTEVKTRCSTTLLVLGKGEESAGTYFGVKKRAGSWE